MQKTDFHHLPGGENSATENSIMEEKIYLQYRPTISIAGSGCIHTFDGRQDGIKGECFDLVN